MLRRWASRCSSESSMITAFPHSAAFALQCARCFSSRLARTPALRLLDAVDLLNFECPDCMASTRVLPAMLSSDMASSSSCSLYKVVPPAVVESMSTSTCESATLTFFVSEEEGGPPPRQRDKGPLTSGGGEEGTAEKE